MTFDEYKAALQRLVASLGVPVEIKEVRPAAGATNPDLQLDVTGSFWGGTFRVSMTRQALDTTIMGANLMQAFDKSEGVVVAQEIFESAAYKRIDAIIEPARALLRYYDDKTQPGDATVFARLEVLRDAIDAEMALRSAAAPPTVPAEPTLPSEGPDER